MACAPVRYCLSLSDRLYNRIFVNRPVLAFATVKVNKARFKYDTYPLTTIIILY